jgi:hypothetical protein
MNNYDVPVLTAFKAGGQRLDIEAILNAPYEDVGEAAAAIPAAIGWLGYQEGQAKARVVNTDFHLKKAWAKEYFALKGGEFVSRGHGEKMTEEALKHAVALSPEVEKAVEAHAAAEKDAKWLSRTIDALSAKMELLRTVEATRRMEHEPDRKKGTIV